MRSQALNISRLRQAPLSRSLVIQALLRTLKFPRRLVTSLLSLSVLVLSRATRLLRQLSSTAISSESAIAHSRIVHHSLRSTSSRHLRQSVFQHLRDVHLLNPLSFLMQLLLFPRDASLTVHLLRKSMFTRTSRALLRMLL